MAEDLVVVNSAGQELLELAICQPEHPNQAVYVQSVDIVLQEFRIKIDHDESAIFLPDAWVFMSRAGSLIPTDQEENIRLTSIVRQRDDNTNVFDVMIAPALSYQPPPSTVADPRAGKGALESFAEISGALRDIYVTSIQPNLHEFIKPIFVAAVIAAAMAFVTAGFLALSLGLLDGFSFALLKPALRNRLCGKEIDVASQVPALISRIEEMESKMSNMRQENELYVLTRLFNFANVEVGTFVCKDEEVMTLFVPFRKTSFTNAPRVTFALRSTTLDEIHHVRLEDLHVNATGFSIRCNYGGSWMRYTMEYGWVAVGK